MKQDSSQTFRCSHFCGVKLRDTPRALPACVVTTMLASLVTLSGTSVGVVSPSSFFHPHTQWGIHVPLSTSSLSEHIVHNSNEKCISDIALYYLRGASLRDALSTWSWSRKCTGLLKRMHMKRPDYHVCKGSLFNPLLLTCTSWHATSLRVPSKGSHRRSFLACWILLPLFLRLIFLLSFYIKKRYVSPDLTLVLN